MKNEGFVCLVCDTEVLPLRTGCRNHCPHCLHSVHLDIFPGDRAANCGGILAPIAIRVHSKKGYMVQHRCERCGYESVNKLSMEDPVQPDELDVVLALMRQRSGGS